MNENAEAMRSIAQSFEKTTEIQLKYGNATFPDLQKARSLLVNRTTRTIEEIKVLSELIQKVDKKMEERKK